MIAVAAYFQAHAIGALVDVAIAPKSIAPFAEARAAEASPQEARKPEGQAILDHNVFDHTFAPKAETIAVNDVASDDPMRVPPCDGVRAIVTVKADNPDSSFAAIDVGGKRHLQKRGGEVEGLKVVFVGEDRVWLNRNGSLCQAGIFDVPAPVASVAKTSDAPVEQHRIEKTGPTSYVIDRSEVSKFLESQTELMKTPLVPEKVGDQVVGYRLVKVKPGSAIAAIGLQAGDRIESIDGVSVTSAEGMMNAYARLSTGTLNHLTIHVTRDNKPINLDYTVK
jgi:general secretion pathway protein C